MKTRVESSGVVGRYLIPAIGVMFILWSLSLVMLGLVGERQSAVITGIRRQGGQRDESVPNRYTYVVSYSLKLPDGRTKDGFSYKIGSAIYVKASGTSLVPVRYFAALPAINALESDTALSLDKLVYVAVGVLLLRARPARKARH